MTNNYGNLELHQVLLAAMKDIDKICREHGLKYSLYAGSLLGAVNHKGLIPWDDDVDLVMFPYDFKKLCEVIDMHYTDRYQLCTFDRVSDWYTQMNKILIKGTKVNYYSDGNSSPIFVDINVLHNVPDKKWQRFLQRKQIEFINLILSTQSGAIIPSSPLTKLTLGNLAKIRREFWGQCLLKIMTHYDNRQTEYVGIMCNTLTRNPYTGKSGYETDTVKRSWYENLVYVQYEDTQLMCIANPKDDLDIRYGPKWAEPYPEEKRVTKHDVKSYEISPEVRERLGL